MTLKNFSIAMIIVSVFFLSGCGLTYEINRNRLLETATLDDYGPEPPANHQELERQVILKRLKNSNDAQFEFGDMRRDVIKSGLDSTKPILVWVTSVRVSVKNTYGKYSRFKPYSFAWKDGRMIAVSPGTKPYTRKKPCLS